MKIGENFDPASLLITVHMVKEKNHPFLIRQGVDHHAKYLKQSSSRHA